MLTSSTVSVLLIPIRESSQRALNFMIELLRRQALSPAFTKTDIITWLINEHITVDPVVVEKHDDKTTLLVFLEDKDIQKYVIHCNPCFLPLCGLPVSR